MEDLLAQFTIFSNQSLDDKSFDPNTIQDLMKHFELESYQAWAAAELEHNLELEQAEFQMNDAETYLDSVMESAMEEFRRFEEEFDLMAAEELRELEEVGERARRMGRKMEKAASGASKSYMEAAVGAATARMKAAVRAAAGKKVHSA